MNNAQATQIEDGVRELHARIAELTAALDKIERRAKEMKKSEKMVGPSEYFDDPRAMKVWRKAVYHEGKNLLAIVREARATLAAVGDKHD